MEKISKNTDCKSLCLSICNRGWLNSSPPPLQKINFYHNLYDKIAFKRSLCAKILLNSCQHSETLLLAHSEWSKKPVSERKSLLATGCLRRLEAFTNPQESSEALSSFENVPSLPCLAASILRAGGAKYLAASKEARWKDALRWWSAVALTERNVLREQTKYIYYIYVQSSDESAFSAIAIRQRAAAASFSLSRFGIRPSRLKSCTNTRRMNLIERVN